MSKEARYRSLYEKGLLDDETLERLDGELAKKIIDKSDERDDRLNELIRSVDTLNNRLLLG